MEHTPTTDEVRRDYARQRDEYMYSPSIALARAFREGGGGVGEFDRWLAAVKLETLVAARASVAELLTDPTIYTTAAVIGVVAALSKIDEVTA
jgi:hypothetical protein